MSQRAAIVIAAIFVAVATVVFIRTRPPKNTSPGYDPQTVSLALRRTIDDLDSPQNRRISHQISSNADYVRDTYKDLFGLELPATPGSLKALGDPVDPLGMMPGDLLFFDSGRSLHVGFYLGEAEFGHYNRWSGPRVDRLDDPTWSSRYVTTRRVIHQ